MGLLRNLVRGRGDGVLCGSDAEVGALQRVQGVTDAGLNLDQNHPLKMVMNGAACCHPLRSFWARQREGEDKDWGEHISQQ